MLNNYTLWPLTWLFLFAAVARSAVGQPYDQAPTSLRVMTWNVEWMFDDYKGDNRSELAKAQSAPSQDYWRAKLAGVAKVLAKHTPDIVALQEIEGQETLAGIVGELRSKHKLSYRSVFIQGTDSFTEQDVGFLVRGGVTSFRRHEQSKTMFDSREFYNLSKHLVCEFRWANVESPLTVMTVHLRATAEAEATRAKQAKLARHWLEPQLAAGQDVILLGDLNSEHAVGDIAGDIAAIVGSSGQPPLVDLLTNLSDTKQSTHLILDKQFDRIFASQSLMLDGPGLDWSFSEIEILSEAAICGDRDGEAHWPQRLKMPSEELDLSDHSPVLATFLLQ